MPHDTHLTELLRDSDRDRYLSTLYAPADRRQGLTALYAFNAEVAAVRDRIREPMAGEVRLQWWRDAINAGAPTGHPVADPLIETIGRFGLPHAAFDRLLEARIFDLYDDAMPDRGTLEGYCGETAATVIQLAALILDPKAAPDWSDAAGYAGCAQAFTGLLRLLPIHLARGQCYMPADILAAAGTSSSAFVAGGNDAARARAVAAMAALANEHWHAFRNRAGALPQPLVAAFLPLAPVPAYLHRISAHPGKALRQPIGISSVHAQLLFLYRAGRGWR